MTLRRLVIGFFVFGLCSSLPAAAKSQAEYLQTLRLRPFKAWHFMWQAAVTHPIDYWLRHDRAERKEARGKVVDFLQGKEYLPEGFERVRVPGGKLTFEGALRLQDETPRPLVIVLPGTFGSHLSSYISDTAELLARGGHCNVLLLATRMSSTTMKKSGVVGSGGLLEGEDLRAVARWLRKDSPWAGTITRIGLYGVSLSGDYVIQALAGDSEGLFGAGLIVSGVYSSQDLARRIDGLAARLNVLKYAWARLFHRYLRLHLEDARTSTGLPIAAAEVKKLGLTDYAARLSFAFYEAEFKKRFGESFGPEDLIRACRTRDLAQKVRTPLLAIHSHQDIYLGFEQADLFAKAAVGNPNVALEYVDGAGHASYYIHSPAWFAGLLDTYFTYWLGDGD